MSKERWIAGCSAVVLISWLAACGGSQTEQVEPMTEPEGLNEAIAEIGPKSGSEVTGQAAFFKEGDKVTLSLSLQNLPPGTHAVHIHEFGDCSADDGSSAGGHWNPLVSDHGKWNETPFHFGDLGNAVADEYGNGSLSITTSLWTIGTGLEDDIVGKSIVVHAGEDDFVTQPTGGAGGRIACGVIGS